jgi:hypothetical protein
MVVNLNGIERKVSILTMKDAYLMRKNILNRLINILNEYIKLPDLDKDEVFSIHNSINELKEKISLINELIEEKSHD